MMLSFPSFLAAASRAEIPPPSEADFAVFQSTLDPVPVPVVPPQAVSSTSAPPSTANCLAPNCWLIGRPPQTDRTRPGHYAAEDTRIPYSPPFWLARVVPSFNHLPDQLSRN